MRLGGGSRLRTARAAFTASSSSKPRGRLRCVVLKAVRPDPAARSRLSIRTQPSRRCCRLWSGCRTSGWGAAASTPVVPSSVEGRTRSGHPGASARIDRALSVPRPGRGTGPGPCVQRRGPATRCGCPGRGSCWEPDDGRAPAVARRPLARRGTGRARHRALSQCHRAPVLQPGGRPRDHWNSFGTARWRRRMLTSSPV